MLMQLNSNAEVLSILSMLPKAEGKNGEMMVLLDHCIKQKIIDINLAMKLIEQ
jgi:hypothetical protein